MLRFALFSACIMVSTTASAAWFTGSDALTSAHQRLLEGNTSQSFDAMVEAWQQENTQTEIRHLTDLLSLAISEDCGRSLSTLSLPSWLQSLVLRRESVQTPNRVYHQFSIYGSSEEGVDKITFSEWPGNPLISESMRGDSVNQFKLDLQGLSSAIPAGLYKLDISSVEGESWSSWILVSQPEPIQKISWRDSRSWRIAPPTDLKSACPRPFLSMNLYQQDAEGDAPIWSEEKDKNLPTSLPVIDVPNGQYWFSVALIERRWQGSILFEDVQRIARYIDFPDVDLRELSFKAN